MKTNIFGNIERKSKWKIKVTVTSLLFIPFNAQFFIFVLNAWLTIATNRVLPFSWHVRRPKWISLLSKTF